MLSFLPVVLANRKSLTMQARFWGLDIGGANIKIADAIGNAYSLPFELWKHPEKLQSTLEDQFQKLGEKRPIALTMTGELADCYASKKEGVEHIVQATVKAAAPFPVLIWQTPGEFVPPDIATEFEILTAASNWHALATWVGRSAPQGTSLLVDCGTTTTDVIPLLDGVPVPTGRTDFTRLQSDELVYLGSRRTPLCTFQQTEALPAPLAAEWFATIEDCMVVTGQFPEQPGNCNTADGRALTIACSQQRVARQFCCDATDFTTEQLSEIAQQFINQVTGRIASAMLKVIAAQASPPELIITSGSGEFLIQEALKQTTLSTTSTLSLSSMCSPQAAECACAMACAILAEERIGVATS